MKTIRNKDLSLVLVSFLLFLFLFPLISKVNFMQNDDWNRVTSVIRFLKYDFSLLPVTATTFYTQGILGFIFSLFFGWQKLPYLTLLFSVLNYYILARILKDHFSLSKVFRYSLPLILFFNPLHMYSTVGFMTENYLLFFMLLSLYFFLSHEKNNQLKLLLLSDAAAILAFFAKQNGVIIFAATLPYFLYKRDFKKFLIQLTGLGLLFAFYYLIFPRTSEMSSKGFILKNISDFNYVYSLIYGILVVICSFILPLVVYFVLNTYLKSSWKVVLLLVVSSAVLYFTLNHFYKPGKISWEEYPYFENTFERTGFLPRSIQGTKYQFIGNYDLYRYWDLISKVVLSLAVPCLVLYRKKIINIHLFIIAGYLVLMIFVETFFDRYILPLIPIFMLYLFTLSPLGLNIKKYFQGAVFSLVMLFIIFIGFFSMELTADFVFVNNYVWGKSEDLVKRENIPAQRIISTFAWSRLYKGQSDINYLFSYDDFKKNPALKDKYILIEKKEIVYPFNIFTDPKIFLYKGI